MFYCRNYPSYGVDTINKSTEIRHLFDSAITPDGLVDYIDTIIQGNYICYYLKGGVGTISTDILSYLAKEYSMKGYAVELYHQPLNPDRLQTLVVEGLKIAVTVNPKMEEGVRRIKLAKLLHDEMEKSYVGSMDFSAVTELRNMTIERIKDILKSK